MNLFASDITAELLLQNLTSQSWMESAEFELYRSAKDRMQVSLML